MSSGRVLQLLWIAWLGAPARAAPPSLVEGFVRYATSEVLYVDRGARDGLAVGTELRLERRGKVVATCRVDAVADRQASCRAPRGRVGDSIRFTPVRRAPSPPARRLPALLAVPELERRREVMSAVRLPKAPFRERPSEAVLGRLLRVSVVHHTWTGFGVATTLHREALEVSIQRLELSSGLRLNLDAVLSYWAQRPGGFRDPHRAPVQFLVREAELSLREPGRAWTLAIGRVWPWSLPGVAVFDGLQVGYLPAEGLEVGGYVGGYPHPTTLAPGGERWTVGAYQVLERSRIGSLRLLRQRARVAVAASPGLGQRIEAEVTAESFWEHRLNLVAEARVGLGRPKPLSVDVARFGATWAPAPFVIRLQARYAGVLPADSLEFSPGAQGVPAVHGEASAAADLSSSFRLAAWGGMARDVESGLLRVYGGPEVAFPRLLGRGGVAVGLQEETGHFGKRLFYLQGNLSTEVARLVTRIAVGQQTPAAGTGDFNSNELGLFLLADVPLGRGFSLRGWTSLRHAPGLDDFLGEGSLRATPRTALQVNLSLTGEL